MLLPPPAKPAPVVARARARSRAAAVRSAARGATLLALIGVVTPGTILAAPWPGATPEQASASANAPARPAERSHANASARSGPRAAAARFDPERSCGSDPRALAERVQAHLARAELAPLPTPHSSDVGEIAVLEDDGTFFYTHNSGNPTVDLMAVSHAFYRTHGDDYDQIAVFLASGLTDWLGSPTAFAACFNVKNDTQGLGQSLYDESAGFGATSGRLQAVLSMNGLHRWLDDPLAINPTLTLNLSGVATLGHEFEHRWGAYVWLDSLGQSVPALLGRGHQHWGFFLDSDASVLEGCDWDSPAPDSFVSVGNGLRYGRLDQYLMGLRDAADVGPLLKIDAPTSIDPPGSYVPTTSPTTGVTCRGVPTNWQVSDVIAANGPRVPAAAVAPHTMRVAIVLAVPRGAGASAADLARLDSLRVHFEPWYSWATDGRGTVDTHLERRAGAVRVTHTRLRDTEDIGTPRALGAHVSVDGGNLGLTIVPSSVHVRLRPVGGGSFGMLMMNPVAPDSFVAIVPPFPGDFEYYLEAASDSVGIAATDPALGPAAPILVHVGPDLSPPLVLHTPVPLQAAFRLPQKLLARVTDNLGVDSVWAEYSVDGGPIASTPTLRAGPDSFTVSLGGGLASGQRLAYRLVARDAASAHNLGLSNPAFDTLHVERDAWEDFENGEGLLHSSAIYSYRDAWHAAVEPLAPERGVGMLCGNDDGPYAPHLDAALYTPYLYAVPPGALLRFDHRYELEDYDATRGWDGGMLEGQSNGGAWLPLTPQGGYPKTLASKVSTVNAGTPCWSGDSQGWRTETVSLASLGSGPAIVRWRMLTDDLFGREGWRVDHVRLIWSDGVTEVPLSSDATPWRVSPNPARQGLRMTLPAGERGAVSWELFDLAGRRVATLWRGELPPGGALQGAVPTTVAPGLYFSRLMRGGHELARARVAIVR